MLRRITTFEARVIVAAVFVFASTWQVARGDLNPFFWVRTTDDLFETSTIAGFAQGQNFGQTVPGDGDGSAYSFYENDLTIDVLAGSGGGGGQGAHEFFPGLPGAPGELGGNTDGQPGFSSDAEGGGGGTKGTPGIASVWGRVIGASELNPDNQAILGYTFAHQVWGILDLEGGGGGAGGGGGGSTFPWDGGNGGWGGSGQDSFGQLGVANQVSSANVSAVMNIDPDATPETPRTTRMRIRVDSAGKTSRWASGSTGREA